MADHQEQNDLSKAINMFLDERLKELSCELERRFPGRFDKNEVCKNVLETVSKVKPGKKETIDLTLVKEKEKGDTTDNLSFLKEKIQKKKEIFKKTMAKKTDKKIPASLAATYPTYPDEIKTGEDMSKRLGYASLEAKNLPENSVPGMDTFQTFINNFLEERMMELSSELRRKYPESTLNVRTGENEDKKKRAITSDHSSSKKQRGLPYPVHKYETTDYFLEDCKGGKYRHLYQDTTANLCFVYEKMTPAYFGLSHNEQSRLDNLGTFGTEREKYVSERHVIFNSPTGSLSMPCNAEGTHFQEFFSRICSSFEAHPFGKPVYFYNPNSDYYNHFLVVLNKDPTIKELAKRFPWLFLKKKMTSELEKTKKTPGTSVVRQKKYIDYGFCCEQSMSRMNSPLGIAIPNIKIGTSHPEVISSFELASGIAKDIEHPLLTQLGVELHKNPEDPDRTRRFVNRISPNNTFENMRYNETHGALTTHPNPMYHHESICSPHNDGRFNNRVPCNAPIVNISICNDDGVRCNGGFQMRSACGRSAARHLNYEGFLEWIVEQVSFLPEHRKEVGELIYENARAMHSVLDGYLEGSSAFLADCHLNIGVGLSGYIDSIALTTNHFKLNYVAQIALIGRVNIMPSAPYWFATATAVLRMLFTRNTLPFKCHQFNFGILVQDTMRWLMEEQQRDQHQLNQQDQRRRYQSNVRELGPPAFSTLHNVYRGVHWQSPSENIETTKCLAKFCLRVWATYPESKSDCENAKAYAIVLAELTKDHPNMGPVIGNNLLAILGAIGLIPPHFRDDIHITNQNKAIKHFKEKFNLTELGKKEGIRRLLKDLQAALTNAFHQRFTIRLVENILCKLYRIDSGQRYQFSNTFLGRQDLYEF